MSMSNRLNFTNSSAVVFEVNNKSDEMDKNNVEEGVVVVREEHGEDPGLALPLFGDFGKVKRN
jgi:hypothetical protein